MPNDSAQFSPCSLLTGFPFVRQEIHCKWLQLSAKKVRMFRALALVLSLVSLAPALFATQLDPSHQLIISVRDQKLMLVQNGGKVATYPGSASMFGVGDSWGRMTIPIGYLAVEKKIGDNVPSGAVFHNRRLTGEILQPNAPGRDPVITRIIWLRGLEAQNAHAFQRGIYIHGTPQEKTIGRPVVFIKTAVGLPWFTPPMPAINVVV